MKEILTEEARITILDQQDKLLELNIEKEKVREKNQHEVKKLKYTISELEKGIAEYHKQLVDIQNSRAYKVSLRIATLYNRVRRMLRV